jgi:uncharacterized protein YkwD
MIMMILAGCGKKVKEDGAPEVLTPGIIADQYLEYVNNHRIKLGLHVLQRAEIIDEQSFEHSRAMAGKKRTFGHYGRALRCRKIQIEFGVGNECGEIVSMGPKDGLAVFQAWMDSDAHRQMIEAAHFTHTGLGFEPDDEGVMYWTQMFYGVP